jgi:PAS domain S-box-containing protein
MSKPKAGQAGTDTVETRLLQRIGELETALAEAKRTLKSKRDGERRLRSLIDQASDPIFCYEANPPFSINLPLQEQIKRFYDCILVDCNEACAQAYGIESPKQAVGSKLTDLFGMRPGSLDKLFTEMIEGGYRTVDGEVTEILPDGRKRFYRNNGHAVIEDGKLMRVWGTFRDVTAQKLAENALQNNKHFLEDVVNSIQDGISVLDTNLNILLVNKNMEDWYAHHTPLQGKKCFHCYQEREQPCDPCPSVRACNPAKRK